MTNADTGFPSRLQEAIKTSGHSVRTLAARLECAEGTIRKYLRGETEPSLSMLLNLAEAIGVDFSWLVSGQGFPTKGKDREIFAIPYLEEFYFDPSQRALHATYREKAKGLLFSPETFRAMIGHDPDALRWLMMDGDSMAPLIRNGNLLAVCRPSVEPGPARETFMPKEGLHAVRLGGNVTVRRLESDPEGERIFFTPENSSYQRFEVQRKLVSFCPSAPPEGGHQVVIIGTIVWIGHKI